MRINNILMMEDNLRKSNFDEEIIKEAKKIGFSDKQIGRCLGIDELKDKEFETPVWNQTCGKAD